MKSFRVTKTKDQIIEQKVKEESSLIELQEFFSLLASARKPTDVIIEDVETVEALEELIEEVESSTEEPSLVDIAAESIKKSAVKESVFELPKGAQVDPDVKALQQRVQDLQNWMSKMAMAGPGSGEVNFRYLDDVNRSTMNPDNDNWILEYDATSKKVKFTNVIGPVDSINTRLLHATGDTTIDGLLEVNNDTTINGDLTVNGDVTYVNTTTLDVTDKNITVAKGAPTPTAADGAGISVDGANAQIIFKQSSDAWQLNKNIIPSGNYTEDLGNLTNHFDQLYVNNINNKSMIFDQAGHSDVIEPGMVAWNPGEDCLDVHHADGTTLQAGLEQHYRVYNSGATTLTQGTLVGFGGVFELDSDQLPIAVPYTASTTTMPLYVMGILTTDIPPLGVGRATVFGKVRTLDTTGATVGETWNLGDLLWAHPTVAGQLTKVQPSAPNPAISVAAILKHSATQGVLLVRPTIFPRLWFGRFRDFTNQTATAINTPYAVRFGQTAASSGFHIDPSVTSRVVAEFNGLYKFDPRLQFTSSNSSIAKIWVWYRVDGVDAPGTGTQYTIQSNGGIVVATLPYIVSLMAGQYFELMWATDSVNVSLLSPAATSFCPATPCAVVAITQSSL